MSSTENISVTENTSQVKQSDREQDLMADDLDDSSLSFSENSSVPEDMMMYDLDDDQSDRKWLGSLFKSDGTTNIQANYVQFNHMKESPSLRNHKATVLAKDRESKKLAPQPDINKTYHGNPVDVEGERSGCHEKISSSNAGHCKSMSFVVKNPTKTVEDCSGVMAKFQQLKHGKKMAEKQLHEVTIELKNEQIKHGKTVCDYKDLMRKVDALVMENDSLKKELKSMEENHHIKLQEHINAWVEQHANANNQKIAELEQVCENYAQYCQEQKDAFKKMEENLMAQITALAHAENYQLAYRLRVEKECENSAQHCQEQEEAFKKKEENLIADITSLTHAENYQLAYRLRIEKELEKTKNAFSSAQVKCRNARRIKDDVLNTNNDLEEQIQTLEAQLVTVVAERDRLKERFAETLRSNGALQHQIIENFQAVEGREQEFRDFIDRLLSPPQPPEPVIDRLPFSPRPPEPAVDHSYLQLPAEPMAVHVLHVEHVSHDHVPD